MRRLALASVLTSLLFGLAQAQEAPYLDDRSDATALVRSLYNAVNRREYARAWDYFGEAKPAKDFDAFVAGYSDTVSVEVETGAASTEGAAGGTFYQVPVAIRARATNGSERVYAGCYTARLANPQAQGTPFRPLQIEKGALKQIDGDLVEALPKSCGDAPPPTEAEAALAQARTAFTAAYRDICQSLAPGAEPGAADPEPYEIRFRYAYESETDPERLIRLYRFPCTLAAYNSVEVFYTVDQYGETKAVTFATPDLDIRYENDDSQGKVESMTIIGYKASDQLLNSEFAPETRTIHSFAKWRGVGDASSIGAWLFRGGEFTLVKYEVDASYDGEIAHETVVDFDTGP